MVPYKKNALKDCEYDVSKYLNNNDFYKYTKDLGIDNIVKLKKFKKNFFIIFLIVFIIFIISFIILVIFTVNRKNGYITTWYAGGIILCALLIYYFICLNIFSKKIKLYYSKFNLLMNKQIIDNDIDNYPLLIQIQIFVINNSPNDWTKKKNPIFPRYPMYWCLYGLANFFDKLNQYYLNQNKINV